MTASTTTPTPPKNPPQESNENNGQDDDDMDAFLNEIENIEEELKGEGMDQIPEQQQQKLHLDSDGNASSENHKPTDVVPPQENSPAAVQNNSEESGNSGKQSDDATASSTTPAVAPVGPSIPAEFLQRRKRKQHPTSTENAPIISTISAPAKKRRKTMDQTTMGGAVIRSKASKPKVLSEAERIMQFKEKYESLNRNFSSLVGKATGSNSRGYSQQSARIRPQYDPYGHQDYNLIKKNLEQAAREMEDESVAEGAVGVSTHNGLVTKEFTKTNDKLNVKRSYGGSTWEDKSLLEWPENDYRIFVGNLGPDVTNQVLQEAFSKYKSLAKVHVVYHRKTEEPKGYGFVSLLDPEEYVNALDTMHGEYIGSRMVQLKPSKWKQRAQQQK